MKPEIKKSSDKVYYVVRMRQRVNDESGWTNSIPQVFDPDIGDWRFISQPDKWTDEEGCYTAAMVDIADFMEERGWKTKWHGEKDSWCKDFCITFSEVSFHKVEDILFTV